MRAYIPGISESSRTRLIASEMLIMFRVVRTVDESGHSYCKIWKEENWASVHHHRRYLSWLAVTAVGDSQDRKWNIEKMNSGKFPFLSYRPAQNLANQNSEVLIGLDTNVENVTVERNSNLNFL